MMADFNQAVQVLLVHEGGYVCNPKDPGGATNFGITIPTLAKYRGVGISTLSATDIQGLQQSEAIAIYQSLWWNKMLLDQITNQQVATVMLDQGVLFGVPVVVERIQGLVGIAVDGEMGPHSVTYINKIPNGKYLAFQLIRSCSHRDIITAQVNNEEEFLGGWIDRLFSLLAYVDYGTAV